MNGIVSFRQCSLSDDELLTKVDMLTDSMFESMQVPSRHIPARPNSDLDLLIGELILRFKEKPTTVFSIDYYEQGVYMHTHATVFSSPEKAVEYVKKVGFTDYQEGQWRKIEIHGDISFCEEWVVITPYNIE